MSQFPAKVRGVCLNSTYLHNSKVVLYWEQPFLVGWVGWFFFCVLLGKNCFWLVWLINLFNQPQTGLKWLKKHLLDYAPLRDYSSHNDYFQELPRFNQKTVGKVFY